MTEIVCPQCGLVVLKPTGSVNRARNIGAPIFCGKACSGLHRRKNKSEIEKRQEKAEYDREYRERNHERRKILKHIYYVNNRNPEKERESRKANMPKHVEYCRRTEYREYKREYDKRRRASEYGEFADAYSTLLEIEKEVRSRMTRFEIYTINERRSAQWRKRKLNSQQQT